MDTYIQGIYNTYTEGNAIPALSVDTSQGRDSKKKKNPAKKEQHLKTQI
jgi:hypothetical protein